MSVENGQPANKDTFNNAFVSRNQNSDTSGIVGLKNTDPVSGPEIPNLQKSVNEAKAVADTVTTLSAEVTTLGQGVNYLLDEFGELSSGTKGQRYTFTYEDFQEFDLDTDYGGVTGLLLPEMMCVDKVVIVLTEAFAGTGLTSAKAWVGPFGGSDPYAYMPITDVSGDPSATNWKSNQCCDVNKYGEEGGNGFDVYFKIEGCELADLTAGSFVVYFYYSHIGIAVETGWR